jgi:hypothetical protein
MLWRGKAAAAVAGWSSTSIQQDATTLIRAALDLGWSVRSVLPISATFSDAFDTQRWLAPVVSVGVVVAVVSTQTGSLLPTYAILATALLFIGTWLTVVIVNNEDPVQGTITEACAGSQARVRLAKLIFSFLFCTALGVLAIVPPVFISSGGVRSNALLAGVSAQAIAALGAVGLGALCSRPIVRRHALSVLLGILVCLGTILIPDGVPSRQLLVLFNKTGQFALGVPILWIALETLIICTLAVAISLKISAART